MQPDHVETIPECALFPLGVSVEIVTRGDSKHVIICARLHMTKRKELPHCYALTYSTRDILNDSSFLKYLAGYRLS